MAVTAYKSSGTQASVDRAAGVAWTSPGNVAASDDSRATCANPGTGSDWLRLTNFGFSTSDIPAGSTIDGLEFEIECADTAGPAAPRDLEIFFRVTAGQVGSNAADVGVNWPAVEAYVTHGGATSLYGRSWTDTEIVSADFGIDIAVDALGGATASVDHVRIRVYYTIPTGLSMPRINLPRTAVMRVATR